LKPASTILSETRLLLSSLAHEYVSPERRPQRLLDEVETVLSVMLAIMFAHLLGAHNVGWAAFSGYMVMRTQLADTLNRAGLRIVGTVAGALMAWWLVTWLERSLVLMSISLVMVGGGTLYAALTRQRSYAWLFTGLTFVMVVLDALREPSAQVHTFAITRALEVVSGTAACLIVNLLSAWTVRPRVHGRQYFFRDRPAPSVMKAWERSAAMHALQAAAALAILPFLSAWLKVESITGAAITIMAVMMIPLATLNGDRGAVRMRVLHRFAGSLLGAASAAIALVFSHGNVPATLLFLTVGIMVGRHVENSAKPFAYVGTQYSLVFLVVFVPDDLAAVSSIPGWERMGGIMLGLAILVTVRFAIHYVQSRLGARAG